MSSMGTAVIAFRRCLREADTVCGEFVVKIYLYKKGPLVAFPQGLHNQRLLHSGDKESGIIQPIDVPQNQNTTVNL
jgi:hypothetical protein